MVRYVTLLCFTLNLLSCYWPPPSQGGYAAHYLFDSYHFRCGDTHSLCQQYTDRLAKSLFELNALRGSHASKCFPARHAELSLLGQQIAQEIAAGLYFSAQLDLNLLYINLQELKQLNTFKGCPRVKNDNGWELLKLRIQ